MKPLVPFSYQPVIILLLAVGLLFTCRQPVDPEPVQGCRLLNSTTPQGTGPLLTTTYSYRADGQLQRKTYSAGNSETWTYDANGYLTTGPYIASVQDRTQTWAFANGRLTTITLRNVATGDTTSFYTCSYDPAGHLTQFIYYSYLSGFTYTTLYANGKQTDYIIRDRAGVDLRPNVYENGRLKSQTGTSSQTINEYDAQGRRTRSTTMYNGKPFGYSTYEYTEGHPAYEAIPAFKGVPGELFFNPAAGLETRNTYYTLSAAGVAVKSSETVTNYAKNAANYPTAISSVSTYYDAAGRVTSTTTQQSTYQYADCP